MGKNTRDVFVIMSDDGRTKYIIDGWNLAVTETMTTCYDDTIEWNNKIKCNDCGGTGMLLDNFKGVSWGCEHCRGKGYTNKEEDNG